MPRFQTLLIDELGYEPEDAEYAVKEPKEAFAKEWDIDVSAHKSYLVYVLLAEFFPCYADDWKFYCEDLSEYISERINQEFYIDDEEVLGNIEVIFNKLESESEYSLLGLESGSDDINIWLIKKSDKPRLLALANELGLMAY